MCHDIISAERGVEGMAGPLFMINVEKHLFE